MYVLRCVNPIKYCTFKDIFLKEILEECPFFASRFPVSVLWSTKKELEEKNMSSTALGAATAKEAKWIKQLRYAQKPSKVFCEF